MKRIIFILTLSTFLFTQQAEITNIQASLKEQMEVKSVDITYDLLPDPVFEFFNIIFKVSLDGGENYQNMTHISGDFGDIIEPGNGKAVTWNFGQQFGGTYSDEIKIKITGISIAFIDNNISQELPFEMVTVEVVESILLEKNNEIRTIDYDYEIMKYEVTDQDYVLFILDAYKMMKQKNAKDLTNGDGTPWYESYLVLDGKILVVIGISSKDVLITEINTITI